MNDKKNTAAASKKAGKGFIQGRMLSLEFFKHNWVYAVFVVAMALAYIGNKFACQRSIQELLSLKNELVDAQTDLVSASANYNSMIRESAMVKMMNERQLGLSAPDAPPYDLTTK